jgi:hypothetical protein
MRARAVMKLIERVIRYFRLGPSLHLMTLHMIVICSVLPLIAHSSPRSLGLGAMVGKPQGLTAQIPITRWTALNTSLYYNFKNPRVDIHLDQIFIQPRPVLVAFYPYVGLGARISLHNQRNLSDQGALTGRVPIGLELGESHLRGFIEITPALEVLPALGFSLQGALGVRYHF